jgi:hypothetical protein
MSGATDLDPAELNESGIWAPELTDVLQAYFRRTDATTKIELLHTGGGERTSLVSYNPEDPRWFLSSQKRGRIANDLLEAIDAQGIATDGVKPVFKQAARALADAKADGTIEEFLRPPAVGQLLDYTERVELVTNEEPIIRVTFDPPGSDPDSIEFSLAEFNGDASSELETRYMAKFYTRLGRLTEDDHWPALNDAWWDRREVVDGEATGAWATASEAVLEELAIPTTVADRSDINDPTTAWYDAAPDRDVERETIPDDESVLWVRSSVVAAAIDSVPGPSDTTELAKQLRDRDALLGKTYQVRTGESKRPSMWPFRPEALEITESDVEHGDRGGERDAEEFREEITPLDRDESEASETRGDPADAEDTDGGEP